MHEGFLNVDKSVFIYPSIVKKITSTSSISSSDSLSLSVYPDYKVYDGRFSNNPWAQELPDPITKLTWDNAAYISRKTSKKLSLKTGDYVTINANNSSLKLPVFVSPGQSENVISVSLGYGKNTKNKIENLIGFNVSKILSDDITFTVDGITLVKESGMHEFATTQDHGYMEGPSTC